MGWGGVGGRVKVGLRGRCGGVGVEWGGGEGGGVGLGWRKGEGRVVEEVWRGWGRVGWRGRRWGEVGLEEG